MKLKSTDFKLVYQTSATKRVERLRLVEGILPPEIRESFERKVEIAVAEKQGPVTSKSPTVTSSKPVRPNFWIPILYVCSFVFPFFMLMAITMSARAIPGMEYIANLIIHYDLKIVFNGKLNAAIGALGLISAPILLGLLTAYLLFKNVRISMKLKIAAWFMIMIAACLIECAIGMTVSMVNL